METLNIYKEQKSKALDLLSKLKEFLIQGEEYGIQIENTLMNKITSGINKAENEKLNVALVGGFSEGKTSIAAAWAEKYDKETMQISQLESTDEVRIYDFEEGFRLVDTPGLFGFKETVDNEKYKDITKKYVSEADLILYVTGPVNPIKESHKDYLVWLFKELNLLDRTVFVINRFDQVSDIEDEDDYLEQFYIKKQNIVNRLINFDIINEGDEISIVAVAANPFEEGISYWLENMAEYKKLSHIGTLQQATANIIRAKGIHNLALASQKSIIHDVISRTIPEAENELININNSLEELNQTYELLNNDFASLNQTIRKSRMNLRDSISSYFTDLILQLEGTNIQNINEFFEKNVGKEGIIVENKILEKFESEIGVIINEISKFEISLNNAVSHYNSLSSHAKKGIKTGGQFLKGGNIKITNTDILKIRDLLFPNIKFKPWGAAKWAKRLSDALAWAGIIIEVGVEAVEAYDKIKKEKEFNEYKREMKSNFEGQRKEYLDFINNNEKFTNLFNPAYSNLLLSLETIHNEIVYKTELRNNFKDWKQSGDYIDAEFQEFY